MKTKRGILLLVLLLFGTMILASTAMAAVENVRCILWQGDATKYHTAIDGQAVRLKGVITTTDTSTIYYRWQPGDGSPLAAVQTLSGLTKYNVEFDHVYSGAVGTPFTALLEVDDVDASMANAVGDTYLVKIEEPGLDAEINIAIDNGLWWLYQSTYNHSLFYTFDGSPFLVFYRLGSYSNNYFASPTASTIQAFAINNHKINGNTNEDPYVEAVQLGMNWLIQGYYSNPAYPMLRALGIAPQAAGNPDGNSNGYGIEVRDYGNRPIYQGGQIMDAIIASGVQPGDDTGRDFTGRGSNWTFGELLQDMCDMYAYGQVDGGSFRGGWRYNWNGASDNSAAQWAAIGMIPAQQAPWNCIVPNWVKTENAVWLAYSYNAGHFGYTWADYQHDWYHNTTPSGMVQMAMDGQVGYDDPATPVDERDPKWIACEMYTADNWHRFLHAGSYSWRDGPLTYGWYAFAKAMRLAVPQPVERITTSGGTAFDWYYGTGSNKGMAQRIVENQYAAGYWDGSLTRATPLTTAWMIIILRPALFQAAPIACFTADPNPTYPDGPVVFDPACSDHSETGKDIDNLVAFEWDWDNDGIYDEASSSPQIATQAFPCASLPCTYPVTLRVTDDNDPPLTATFTLEVAITNPPHPPVADAGGPYMTSLCEGDQLTLDGSGSFDPNEGESEAGCTTCPGDTITAWDWDFTPPLTGFDDASGVVPTLEANAIASFFGPGTHTIGLQVTDNTALAFPGSGDPNLTDADFTQVMVLDACDGLCDLYARPKRNKVQLTWAPGAASYDIYRSTAGSNGPFVLIADDHVTDYATYLDTDVVMGRTYFYRVVDNTGCGSRAARATLVARSRR